MHIGFIGAGKVGFTLGKYFSVHGIPVAGYYSRDTAHAQQAAQFTQSRAFDSPDELIPCCDALFLTVPDSSIASVFRTVRRQPIQNKLICHCSGALSAQDAFPEISSTGAFGYSVHPLFAVSDPYHAYEELPDVFFALEGHPARLQEVQAMLSGIGLRVQLIDPTGKALYHCAAASASNLMHALFYHSAGLLEHCGFSSETALAALLPLALGNLQHIRENGLVQSLTGPVERGDADTVLRHLQSLSDPDDQILYTLLSRKLLPLAQQKHPERSYQKLEEILSGKEILS